MVTIPEIFAANGLHLQETDYSCGPASLLNVLLLKGMPLPEEADLVRLCSAEPGRGTAQETMITACADLGLEIAACQENGTITDLEQLLDDHRLVMINYIEPFSGDGHYSLITDHDHDAFYLRDCWLGLLRLPKKRLDDWWCSGDRTRRGWYLAIV